MPALISTFGYSAVTANALSAPVYLLAMGATIFISIHATQTKEWYRHLTVPLILAAAFFAAFAVAIKYVSIPAEFTFLFLSAAVSYTYVGPFQAWCQRCVCVLCLVRGHLSLIPCGVF
jgi:hypothetical protein